MPKQQRANVYQLRTNQASFLFVFDNKQVRRHLPSRKDQVIRDEEQVNNSTIWLSEKPKKTAEDLTVAKCKKYIVD